MSKIRLTRSGPNQETNFEYQWSGSFLQAHLLSDIGKKRERNEDFCILCAPEDKALARQRGRLFAVADGMGGASGGAFASRVALETIANKYYTQPFDNIPACLTNAFEEANRRIFEESENDPKYYGMGTTASAVVILGDAAYIAQVGDSRVYVARGNGGRAHQVTDDHSLVAEQVRDGYISEEEARNHSLKNLITRAVGIKDKIDVDLFAFHVKQDDTLLICSDGLSNMVDDEAIGRALMVEDVQGVARVLVGRALDNGGSDNVSVAVIRVTAAPPKTSLQQGAAQVDLPNGGFLGRLRKLVK